MNKLYPALFFGLSIAVSSPVAAYPVDCAILLCLAGGWPASAECTYARAVFIRRITPWPIEPPLQIWNCPMRVSLKTAQLPVDRLFDIAFHAKPLEMTASSAWEPVAPVPVDAQADINISDPAFDFIRSIRVFEIWYSQRRDSDGGCYSDGYVFLGSYGKQGNYSRQRSTISDIPRASDFAPPPNCGAYFTRSVFVEWRDYEGNYGHEEVHY